MFYYDWNDDISATCINLFATEFIKNHYEIVVVKNNYRADYDWFLIKLVTNSLLLVINKSVEHPSVAKTLT